MCFDIELMKLSDIFVFLGFVDVLVVLIDFIIVLVVVMFKVFDC